MGACLESNIPPGSDDPNDPMYEVPKEDLQGGGSQRKCKACCPYCTHTKPPAEFQLVILGPGYTGKTTLRHHLVQKYGHSFCKTDFFMYRDILQHNVLDLFRDLLKEPLLSFSQLRRFITHIHKKTDFECNELETIFNEFEELSEHNLSSSVSDQEFKFNVDYLSEPDTKYKYKGQHMNVPSLSFESSDTSTECTINTTTENIGGETNNEHDAGGTIYNDKYSSVGQNSPSSRKADGNFDDILFKTMSTSQTHSSLSFDEVSHSESTSTDSNNGFLNFFKEARRSTLSVLCALKPNQSNIELQSSQTAESNNGRSPKPYGVFCGYRESKIKNEEKLREKFDGFGVDSLSDLLHRLKSEKLKYGRDNGQYLIEHSDRILNEQFEPSFDDLLQCHVRSTGLMFENHVVCRSLPVSKYNKKAHRQQKEDIVFRIVDVGGHRNERKKWTYVLQQKNDVICFVISAASFCQVLFEDFQKNAMRESISVWSDILDSNGKSEHSQFLLVINKIDLFYERSSLFKEYFPEYDGDDSPQNILNYIKSLYLDIAKEHNVTVHVVCTKLTDALAIAPCNFDQMKDILLSHRIEDDHPLRAKHENVLNADMVQTILDYAVGDVFWSEKWLEPMWQNKIKAHKQEMMKHQHQQNQSKCKLSISERVRAILPS